MHTPSLDGRTFVAVENASGQVDTRTLFRYEERAGVVSGSYAGGEIVRGTLVGTRDGDTLTFRYVHLDVHGATSSGRCESTVSVLPDGRLRLDEDWAWESRDGVGTSVVEELPGATSVPAVRVLGIACGNTGGHRVDLLSIETWPDRWDLRFARSATRPDVPALARRIPPADAWSISDDLGTTYEVLDVNGRGDRERSTGEVQLRPELHANASRLTVSVALVSSQPELVTTVELR